MTPDTPIKFQTAAATHEMFYAEIVEMMLRLKIKDEEAVAVFGRLIGYQLAYSPRSPSVEHMLTVFRLNIRRGMDDIRSGRGAPSTGKPS